MRTSHSHTNKKTNAQHKKKHMVGLVYAEWCGHCQALKPEWQNMKSQIEQNPQMREQCEVITVESDDQTGLAKINQQLREPLNVSGYPTIFSIDANANVPKLYNGPRKSDELLQWAKNGIHNKKTIHKVGGRKKKYTKKRKAVRFSFW